MNSGRVLIDQICDTIILFGIVFLILALPMGGKAAVKAWGLLLPLAAWFVKMFNNKKLLFEKTPVDMSFAAVFIVILLSCIISIRPPYSIQEFQHEFLCHFTLFYIITSNIKKDFQFKTLLWSIIIGYSWVAIYGIAGYYMGFGIQSDDMVRRRAKSVMGHPGEAAFTFALIIPLVMGVCIYEKKKTKKIILCIFILISSFFLVLTFSRGGWIGTGIALVFIFFKRRTKLLFLLLGLMLLISPFVPKMVIQRITTTTIGDRVFLWKSAICMIADHPLLGIGYGNRNYQQLYPQYSFYGIQEGNLQNAHNFYLQILVEMGILGGLAFLSLFKAIILSTWKTFQKDSGPFRKGVLLGGLGTIIAFLIFSTTTWRYENDIALLFWIIISILIAIHINKETVTGSPEF